MAQIVSIKVTNLKIKLEKQDQDNLHGMPEREERWHFKARIASLAPWSCRSRGISSCVSTFLPMKKKKTLREEENRYTKIYCKENRKTKIHTPFDTILKKANH